MQIDVDDQFVEIVELRLLVTAYTNQVCTLYVPAIQEANSIQAQNSTNLSRACRRGLLRVFFFFMQLQKLHNIGTTCMIVTMFTVTFHVLGIDSETRSFHSAMFALNQIVGFINPEFGKPR